MRSICRVARGGCPSVFSIDVLLLQRYIDALGSTFTRGSYLAFVGDSENNTLNITLRHRTHTQFFYAHTHMLTDYMFLQFET